MAIPYTASDHPSQQRLDHSENDLGGFDTVQYRVISILKQFEECRNSDKFLLHRYYQIFENKDTQLNNVDTTPESITRARRKVQKLNESLAAAPEFKEARALKQEEYREHYGKKKVKV